MPNIKIYRKTPKAGVKMISDLASRSYKGFLFECKQFWQFFTVTKILGGQSKFPQTQPWESKLLRVTAPCLRWYKSKVITIDGLSSLETWKYSVFHARKHQKKKNQKDQENVVLLIRDPSGFIFEPTLWVLRIWFRHNKRRVTSHHVINTRQTKYRSLTQSFDFTVWGCVCFTR